MPRSVIARSATLTSGSVRCRAGSSLGVWPVSQERRWRRPGCRVWRERRLLARGCHGRFPAGRFSARSAFRHFYFPEGGPPGALTIESGEGDPSTITDFNGFIGVGDFTGGTGKDQANQTLYWKSDLRFMDGEYIGVDGRHRQGAFVFV